MTLLGMLAVLQPQTAFSQAVDLIGKVVGADSSARPGASVRLLRGGLAAATDAEGRFKLSGPSALHPERQPNPGSTAPSIRLGDLFFQVQSGVPIDVEILDLRGRRLGHELYTSLEAGFYRLPLGTLARDAGAMDVLVRLGQGGRTTSWRIPGVLLGEVRGGSRQPVFQGSKPALAAKASAAAVDTLRATAVGFQDRDFPVTAWTGDMGTLVLQPVGAGKPMPIAYRRSSPLVDFGVSRLASALRKLGYAPEFQDISAGDARTAILVRAGASDQPPAAAFASLPALPSDLKKEGFRIGPTQVGGRTLHAVDGADESGAMYGLLELAEQISMQAGVSGLPSKQVNARFPFRAIKFNLPWSTYRVSPFLGDNMPIVRDTVYWRHFLDMMAENRFNTLTLWNLHPFPYLVRSKSFPKASPFSDAEFAQWQIFWKSLFRMAKERGVATYLVNWNIFVNRQYQSAYGGGTVDDHHIGDGANTPQIENYTRESVTQVLDEYPDLTGLGVSLGEMMGGMTPTQREDWILRTVVAGMQAAKRPSRLIHRVPFSANTGSGGSANRETETMTRNALEAIDLPGSDGPIWVEAKFNWSHGHSTPRLVQTHGGELTDAYWNPAPRNYSMTWMIRNEDFFILRWGQPDFIRKHIAMNGQNYVGGYFVGSECYIPAKDFSHQPGHAHFTWSYAFQKQWLFYQQWGRLLYDPSVPDEVFAHAFDVRHGGKDGVNLVKAHALAGKMPLRLASFFHSGWDFTLYSEGFYALPDFITLNRLIDQSVLDPDYVSIKAYVDAVIANRPVGAGKITPFALADSLEADGRSALMLAASVTAGARQTLLCELEDIRAWSHLSLYFAAKLRGGVALQTFRKNGNAAEKTKAIAFMQTASGHWNDLVAVGKSHYRPIPLVHFTEGGAFANKEFSWDLMLPKVAQDIATAQGG